MGFGAVWLFALTIIGSRAEGGPRYIIIMIGDGMGVAQVTAGRVYKGSLALERCAYGGLSITHSTSGFVTDSAAGATALATGFPTDNGVVSQSPDGDRLKTVLEYAEERGWSTGIVVTSSVTHATPACFSSHVKSRGSELDIALGFLDREIEVILGGGQAFFLPEDVKPGTRPKRNLVEEFRSRGYVYVDDARGMRDCGLPPRLLGLFAAKGMPSARDREPSLPEMTLLALRILSRNPKGFFLMIEGSQIDWKCHDNDGSKLPREVADFDDAVAEAIGFVESTPESLLVVTADHETGGLALNDGSYSTRSIKAEWTTKGHTGTMVPVFSHGLDAELFGGIQGITDIGRKLIGLVRAPGVRTD